jgi:hypothetical protein
MFCERRIYGILERHSEFGKRMSQKVMPRDVGGSPYGPAGPPSKAHRIPRKTGIVELVGMERRGFGSPGATNERYGKVSN